MNSVLSRSTLRIQYPVKFPDSQCFKSKAWEASHVKRLSTSWKCGTQEIIMLWEIIPWSLGSCNIGMMDDSPKSGVLHNMSTHYTVTTVITMVVHGSTPCVHVLNVLHRLQEAEYVWTTVAYVISQVGVSGVSVRWFGEMPWRATILRLGQANHNILR